MADDLRIIMPGPVARVGDGIAERLKLVFPEAQFEHSFVPAKLDGALWNKLVRRPPFVGLGFLEMDPKPGSNTQFVGDVRWAVFLATKNAHSPRARFFGDKFAPGALQMMEVAIAVLQGWTLKGFGPCAVIGAANSFIEDWKDDTLAMTTLHLSMRINFAPSDVLAGIDPCTLSGGTVTWSFAGGTNPALIDNWRAEA